MPIRTRTRIAAAALLIAPVLGLVGCTHTDIATTSFLREHRPIAVEITGDAPVLGAPVAVDIHNHMGSVIVEVDDRIDAPEITAHLIRPKDTDGDSMPDQEAPDAVTAAYEAARDGGIPANASTLRIASRLVGDYPRGSSVALRVRVPRCDGLNIVNNNGPIVILGTKGTVTAQSGVETGIGGRIEFRSSQPLRDPVALITAGGRITAVIDPGGAAQIELATEEGQAFFSSAHGSITDVRPGVRSYRGTWNGGKTPFVARSGGGDITVFVKPDAEEYSTADDWMAVFRD
jgi:hypothetical protein